jgi:predicted PurR-regulated permease PerM
MTPLPSPPFSPDRKTVFRVFFFGAFLFLLYELLKLLSPFFSAILAAITLALIFYPIHAAILRRLGRWENLAAGLTTTIIMLMIILPFVFFLWHLIEQAGSLTPFIIEKTREWRSAPSLSALLPAPLARAAQKLHALAPSWRLNLRDLILDNADQLGRTLSSVGGRVIRNTLFLFFDLFVTAFSLFFLFRDGGKIARWIVDMVPMEPDHKQNILARLDQTLSAVVRGVFLTAAAQGLLAGIGYAVCGVRFAVLLGFATAFLAPVPLVGAVAVWLPVAAALFFSGSHGKAIGLTLWCALVVSLLDNVLRPILIGEKANLPVLLLFFGMLGGLQVHGPVGLLTGPLLIACALAFAKIYREQVLASRPPESPAGRPPPPPD